MLIFKPFVLNNLYTQVLSYLRIDTNLEERKYGFKDACSRLVELEETLRIPSGYQLQGGEKLENLDGPGAGFTGYGTGRKPFAAEDLSSVEETGV